MFICREVISGSHARTKELETALKVDACNGGGRGTAVPTAVEKNEGSRRNKRTFFAHSVGKDEFRKKKKGHERSKPQKRRRSWIGWGQGFRGGVVGTAKALCVFGSSAENCATGVKRFEVRDLQKGLLAKGLTKRQNVSARKAQKGERRYIQIQQGKGSEDVRRLASTRPRKKR